MRDVAIIGAGMIPVGEHWENSLRMLAADALRIAMADADVTQVDALYVGNAYGSTFSSQTHLGALIADYAGLVGIEAYAIDAAEASGAAALRTAYLAVASGAVETALVVGVEKSTDAIGAARVEGRNISLDADFESIHGATLPALAGLLMRRYMYEYGLELSAFEGFSVNAHANGKLNVNAMFRNALKPGGFAKASMVADPINLFDGAPDADGAAAVILVPAEKAVDMVSKPIRILASAASTDTLALQDRHDFLHLNAVERSTERALMQAQIGRDAIDLMELHDAFTILSALTLEAAGFAERGQGWKLASDSGEGINLRGNLPMSTFGGLKSRGNPVGATGIYQAVEAVLQLRGEAGANQVEGASIAFIQNLGGLASSAFSHILGI
ncbi:MAG: thiolase domain-containing protein [Chitinophagaceae bacterium]|nr:thiolase domain-containing protein [Anaerolineae bacterium]